VFHVELERLPCVADALWASACETAFWPAGALAPMRTRFLRAANRQCSIGSPAMASTALSLRARIADSQDPGEFSLARISNP
jgi:hypothetical protein